VSLCLIHFKLLRKFVITRS